MGDLRRVHAPNNTGGGFSISPHNLGTQPISIRFEDCTADNRGQLNKKQCKAQDGCGWSIRAGFSLSIFG